ncbi:MAG: hypothetical protein WD073_03835 [Xanthobacteraceae bacterium]
MMRSLAAAPIALFVFVCALTLAATAIRAGLVPEDGVALWAAAVMGGDGELPISSIVVAYPSIPFVSATLVQMVTPNGTPSPALLTAGLVAVMAGLWFRALRAAGRPTAFATIATLLLVFHPMLLRTAIAGSADMFLGFFLYLFGNALYDLRARSGLPAIMMAGLALLGAAFSHPLGPAIAAAAMPFLAFTVRPVLVAGSAVNIVLTLAFPTLFGAAAFAYVSWVSPARSIRFFASNDVVSGWTASLGPLPSIEFFGLAALDAGLVMVGVLIAAAPLAFVAIAWVYRRRPLLVPVAIFAAIAVTAASFAVVMRLDGNFATLTVAAPILAAIVLGRIPIARYRHPIVLLLLLLGFLGGAGALAVIEPRTVTQVADALQGGDGDRERMDALALGAATDGRRGVLVDGFNAPAVVLGRGHASGLLLPPNASFSITMLLSRIDAPFVAVPDPHSRTGARDRLNEAFPLLYRNGPPGYRLIYQNNTWRLFARESAAVVYAN